MQYIIFIFFSLQCQQFLPLAGCSGHQNPPKVPRRRWVLALPPLVEAFSAEAYSGKKHPSLQRLPHRLLLLRQARRYLEDLPRGGTKMQLRLVSFLRLLWPPRRQTMSISTDGRFIREHRGKQRFRAGWGDYLRDLCCSRNIEQRMQHLRPLVFSVRPRTRPRKRRTPRRVRNHFIGLLVSC
jgi:hypothetical protein